MHMRKSFVVTTLSVMLVTAPAMAEESAAAPQIAENATERQPSNSDQKSTDIETHGAGPVVEIGRQTAQARPLIQRESITDGHALTGKIAPVLVTRNSIVLMEYSFGSLTIQTEGRALSQGRDGDRVRIMNLNSKSIIAATVAGPSKVIVK